MKRAGLLVILLLSIVLAHAQEATDLLARLSKEDVSKLLRGATVDFTSARGNHLSWRNDLDGTMLANSTSPGGKGTSQKGSWKIDGEGRYCISIDWPSNIEKWCRYVIKDGDIYYLTRANGERISNLLVTR
jgi:hypothetical protein